MTVVRKFQRFAERAPSIIITKQQTIFIQAEYQKGAHEIASLDEHEDAWFNNKFYLIGALLAATIGYMRFGGDDPSDSPETRLSALLGSSTTGAILAIACVVALSIDMHIRDNMCVTNQLGLWSQYYAEPALLRTVDASQDTSGTKTRTLPITHAASSNHRLATLSHGEFYAWEQFLREDPGGSTRQYPSWPRSKRGGMHNDDLWALTVAPHVHFLTVLVLLIYLGVFQHLTLVPLLPDADATRRAVATSCFMLVAAGLISFTWVAHSGPRIFEFRVIPFADLTDIGARVPLYYVPACLGVIILQLPFIGHHVTAASARAAAR